MVQRWVQSGDVGTLLGVGRTTGFRFVREFESSAQPSDIIKDGKLKLIRISALEDFLTKRGSKNEEGEEAFKYG